MQLTFRIIFKRKNQKICLLWHDNKPYLYETLLYEDIPQAERKIYGNNLISHCKHLLDTGWTMTDLRAL